MGEKRKRFWRRLGWAALFVLAAGFALLMSLNQYVKNKAEEKILSAEEAAALDADCILVLGCGVREDGTPSHMLEDRLLQGIALYQAGAAGKLLMSGDHGSVDYDEVNLMKAFAIERGVPSEDIFMDHAGFSTYESMVRAKEIFQVKRVIVVSQKYHLYRALYLAECMGMEACGVASDPRSYRAQAYREIREIAARAKDMVWSILQPDPAYLGEPIPISGNGDVTNDKA
ncbi:YdcF family protein [Anaerotignum lactatifermentans]|uniref:YdcF family protein n=1 Tax=Anaerotignum lactatifermentans TaxID=160404 RepID=A0ABS2GAW5_9FIRM|nr:ElyC/SanA/YdcF family protein [Anaerotignum lactatifermentans]MBM6828663.1 YdcF family protein [Anaerotignum lactatifermentans]MBM6878581.1 YdcF family protein [Anaerotignum lactatifermentans]MBM6950245.1 YdcF family protein [Anaerotignum lactatifermentans]